jgi:AraC-like DNA-binding protein
MSLFATLPRIPSLWPFHDAWAGNGRQSHTPLKARRPSADAGKSFVQEAIQVLWSLQETQNLNQASARALFQAVMTSLEEHPDRGHVAPWLNTLRAQQLALNGDLASARSTLASPPEQQDAGEPLAMACEVMGWYRLALLSACHMSKETLREAPQRDAIDIQACQRALAPALPILRRLQSCQNALPSSLRSHLTRISAVAFADDPMAFGQKAWSLLLLETLRAPSPLQRAHAMLALGLACRTIGQEARSREGFVQSWHAAQALQWRPGAWLSGIALLSAPRSDDGPAVLDTVLGNSLHTMLEAWQGEVVHAMPQTHGSDAASVGKPSRVDNAIAFIRQHAGTRFSVEDLARHCGVSTRTLSQDFKDTLGLSPHDAITRERMQLARQLLNEGDRKLVDVAGLVGYDTALGLSKAYVKVFGEAPRSRLSRIKG